MSAIFGEDGRVREAISVVEDITDQRRVEDINRSGLSAEEKSKARIRSKGQSLREKMDFFKKSGRLLGELANKGRQPEIYPITESEW